MIDEQITAIANRLKEENRREAKLLAKRRLDMQREARRVASEIAAIDPTVRRVLLFGSLLPGRTITRQSDIDLLIDGGSLSRALEVADRSEFPVDVLAVEDLRPGIASLVLQSVEVLYESES